MLSTNMARKSGFWILKCNKNEIYTANSKGWEIFVKTRKAGKKHSDNVFNKKTSEQHMGLYFVAFVNFISSTHFVYYKDFRQEEFYKTEKVTNSDFISRFLGLLITCFWLFLEKTYGK